MKQAMEGCFLNHVEVIVLDRPNPLGGLKVDGPMLDPQWVGPNLVNEFNVPYVHGLTIGELARFAKYQPGVLEAYPEARAAPGQAQLTVIAYARLAAAYAASRKTGLAWVPTWCRPTSPTFAAVAGYLDGTCQRAISWASPTSVMGVGQSIRT